jgi:hypothetical protein
VRRDDHTGVDGVVGLLVGGVAVPERDPDPGGREPADRGTTTLPLHRQGRHDDRAGTRREQPVDVRRARVAQECRVVRAGVPLAEPGALEVGPGQCSGLDEGPQRPHLRLQPVQRVGDEAGDHRRGAVPEVGGGHRGGRLRSVDERRAPAAVGVQVDEARGERDVTEVDDLDPLTSRTRR